MASNGSTGWHISGEEVVSCNCAWGCPCQFNALPTYGNCEALTAMDIQRGHFGSTPLDGVRFDVRTGTVIVGTFGILWPSGPRWRTKRF